MTAACMTSAECRDFRIIRYCSAPRGWLESFAGSALNVQYAERTKTGEGRRLDLRHVNRVRLGLTLRLAARALGKRR